MNEHAISAIDFEGYLLRAKRDETARSGSGYPFNIPAVQQIESIDFHPRVTFLIGENGAGKSTITEAIAIALRMNAEGGGRNFNFETERSHSSLGDHLTTVLAPKRPKDTYFLRAESFYNVASEIDRIARGIHAFYGGKSLHTRSHGESFMDLLIHRFHAGGLYILDEPESALSPTRQLAALQRISELTKQGCQFIISTHSPILMGYPDAHIYELSTTGIERIDYEKTEHYAVTKRFLTNRESVLRELEAEDNEC